MSETVADDPKSFQAHREVVRDPARCPDSEAHRCSSNWQLAQSGSVDHNVRNPDTPGDARLVVRGLT